VVTYNICRGGGGREQHIAAVLGRCDPDLVVLQEATRPRVVARIAAHLGMRQYEARPGHSLGFMSRDRVDAFAWHKPRLSRHAFLEIAPAGAAPRVFGLHLSAVHSAWTEQRRLFEIRAAIDAIRRHGHGAHVLVGDFNTLAPRERLDIRQLPHRLRAIVWLSGGRIRWRVIQSILDAGYVDEFRRLHADRAGLTFPTWNPHVRLDYVFASASFAEGVRSCDVFAAHDARRASDHFPVVADLADRP
jgi:exodeoxyribonuclease-3